MKQTLRPALRPAAMTAVIAGVVILLLNPPSLSGAEELVALLAGAVILVVATAWLTVALTGSEGPSEPEVERLVERSERLARRGDVSQMAPDHPAAQSDDFEALVADAIDRLPDEFRRLLEETPVVISDRGREAGAYGHYFGDTVARESQEDRIVIYRDTLERDFGHDPERLRASVERTLRHELAHHLGWNEGGVRGLDL